MTFSWLNKGLDYTPPKKRVLMPLGKLIAYSHQHWVPFALYILCISVVKTITGPYIAYVCAAVTSTVALLWYGARKKYPELTAKGTTPRDWGIATLVGIVGIVAWIAPYHFFEDIMFYQIPIFGNENIYLSLTFGDKGDPTYQPFVTLAQQWQIPFVIVRIFGAVVAVSFFEELMTRSLIPRFIVDEKYKNVPIGYYSRLAFLIALGFFVLSHPWWFVALIWGLMIFWLYYYCKNLLLCVWAHAVSNALLAVYVLQTGNYYLW